MKQTKLESLIEINLNVFTGFIVSYFFWLLVVIPLIDSGNLDIHDNFIITSMFTIIAVIRGYIWRRFFNKELHKVVHKYITKR